MLFIRKTFIYTCLLAITVISIPLLAHAEKYAAPIVITPDTLKWRDFDAFPPGAKAALLAGNPRSGYFMLRVKLPAHYKVPPNWQSIEIYVTVISGSYSIGVGDTFNPKTGKTLPSTGSVIIPANTHLYFWSKKGAILEIHGVGPWTINYINPKDDPRLNH